MAFDVFNELHDNRQSDSIPYYSFYDSSGDLITGTISVELDDNGQFSKVTAVNDGVTTVYTDFTYTTECLYVLGIGFLLPGDIVKLKIDSMQTYELGYGWHTNVSNQTIYSWYLTPIPITDYFEGDRNGIFNEADPNITNTGILTFYKEYLNTICVVSFSKNRVYFDKQ